ncbi:MAG: SMP-30/gluconolactonase/LRE family protein [Chloroflexota bacterium]|nr:SMP-30/gluconolactonase/LRE family protein [Chloroflexota bacterium]
MADKRSDGLKGILPKGAVAVKLNKGQSFVFTEGPAWDGAGNLYFSDIPPQLTYRMDSRGTFTVFRRNTNAGNGLCFNHAGNILMCEGGAHRVTEVDLKAQVVRVVASEYGGKPLNAPNDIIVARDGGIYFSDPGFGTLNQDVNAVYYVGQDGVVVRVAQDAIMPNGVMLSPDERTLYIDDTYDRYVWAYDVRPDGRLGPGRKFCELKVTGKPSLADGEGKRVPVVGYPSASIADGMAVDALGNLYVTTQIGVQVFDKAGAYLGNIEAPEQPSNVDFGGPDMRTLFITGWTSVYAVTLSVQGVRFPQG